MQIKFREGTTKKNLKMVNLNNRRKLASFPVCPFLHCLPDTVCCTLQSKGRSENSLKKCPSYRFEPRRERERERERERKKERKRKEESKKEKEKKRER
jgi:hypothetical protein